MDKEFIFYDEEICDWCGSTGAYDVYGDYICRECMNDMLYDPNDDNDEN